MSSKASPKVPRCINFLQHKDCRSWLKYIAFFGMRRPCSTNLLLEVVCTGQGMSFVGITFMMCGHFREILLVVSKGLQPNIVVALIKVPIVSHQSMCLAQKHTCYTIFFNACRVEELDICGLVFGTWRR